MSISPFTFYSIFSRRRILTRVNVFRRFLVIGLGALAGLIQPIHAGEAVRIAILNASSSDELEPLLTAILSKTEGIALVERTEVERILQEHALSKAGDLKEQLSIASLLHANGLLILGNETVDKTEIVTARLTAVEPGVVIGSALFAMRRADPESLAQDITLRFTPLLRKLNVKREEAVPISLLRLRCSVKSAETETLENQLAFLFANRLIAQPGVLRAGKMAAGRRGL